jgi:hypothetical protein
VVPLLTPANPSRIWHWIRKKYLLIHGSAMPVHEARPDAWTGKRRNFVLLRPAADTTASRDDLANVTDEPAIDGEMAIGKSRPQPLDSVEHERQTFSESLVLGHGEGETPRTSRPPW